MSPNIFSDSNHPLIAYLMAGYPTPDRSLEAAEAVLEGGADALELGVPFSDPIADGPIIQKASTVALRQNVSLRLVLSMAEALSRRGKPIYIMSYLNPILRLGYHSFAKQASQSGVSGVIIPDLPVDLSGEWVRVAWGNGLGTIFLATPATPPGRLKKIAQNSTDFVYLVSVYGVTGVREGLPEYTYTFIRESKRVVNRPIALGFGVSNPHTVTLALKAGADGVIVGSALISVLMRDNSSWNESLESLKEAVRALKQATGTRASTADSG
ncbi:MAG: tryptophan synthase subunit alpha [Thermoprotei archaeon]